MTATPTSITTHARQQSENVALLWVTRLAAESDNQQLAEDRLPACERAELQHWLEAAPCNAQAYARARQVWQAAGNAAARLAAQEDAALQTLLLRARRHKARPGRRLAALGIAATLALAAVSGLYWQPEQWLDNLQADYHTAPGQVRQITLADGSEVALDGNSAIDVSLSATGRDIHLRRGAAFFHVSHNGQPFVVHAEQGEVRVLGTRFEVRDQPSGTQVTVEQGQVAVSPLPGTPPAQLSAAQRVDYGVGRMDSVQSVDPQQAFAWREGRLSFRRVSLADALAIVQRDYPQRIVLLNAALGARTVSGDFTARDPRAVLAAFKAVLGFEVQTLPGGTLVIH